MAKYEIFNNRGIQSATISDSRYETEITIIFTGSTRWGVCEHFVRDKESGRCYILTDSSSQRLEMDGALVRRRIPRDMFEEALRIASQKSSRSPTTTRDQQAAAAGT